MTSGYHLSEYNAPRRCGECGDRATAYLHKVGFRCGSCHIDAPNELAAVGESMPLMGDSE